MSCVVAGEGSDNGLPGIIRSVPAAVSATNKSSAVVLPEESTRPRGRTSRWPDGSKLAVGGGYVCDSGTQCAGSGTAASAPVIRSVTCSPQDTAHKDHITRSLPAPPQTAA